MADEAAATPATEPTTPTNPAPATPPAGAQNAETPAEPMIPKSRLDEVLAKLKNYETEKTKAEKAQADAEAKRLADEGKFKELYEKQQAELQASQAEAKAAATKLMQRDIAAKTNLPLPLAERLRGDTAEEMEADAKSIMAALPKPAAPNINANPGPGGAPAVGQLSDDEKRRIADRYGVDPRYVQ